jgi:hypothetical protein
MRDLKGEEPAIVRIGVHHHQRRAITMVFIMNAQTIGG